MNYNVYLDINAVPFYAWNRPLPSTIDHQFVPRTSYVKISDEQPWECPKCGVSQLPSGARTVEIVEPGKERRVEYHGKIRPTYFNNVEYGSWIEYSCLVCGHNWDFFPEEDLEARWDETNSCCNDNCHLCGDDRDEC